MEKVITQLPEAKGERWKAVIQQLRILHVVSHDFTGELRLNFRSGGISTVIKTEVVR